MVLIALSGFYQGRDLLSELHDESNEAFLFHGTRVSEREGTRASQRGGRMRDQLGACAWMR